MDVPFSVGSEFPSLRAQSDGSGASVVGACIESWGWDVKRRALFHSGVCIGRYPPSHIGRKIRRDEMKWDGMG